MLSLMFVLVFAFTGWTVANMVFLAHTNDREHLIDYLVGKVERLFVKKKELPPVPQHKLFPRPNPLDYLSDSVFNDWLNIPDNRTLYDYCAYETETEKHRRESLEKSLEMMKLPPKKNDTRAMLADKLYRHQQYITHSNDMYSNNKTVLEMFEQHFWEKHEEKKNLQDMLQNQRSLYGEH